MPAIHVGPVVAEEERIGLALLSRAMAATPAPVILDVPDRHRGITTLARVKPARPRLGAFMLSLRGPCPAVEDAARIFALAGPELA